MQGRTTTTVAKTEGLPMRVHHYPGMIGRRGSIRVTTLSPHVEFAVHDNNMANLTRGLVERVFLVQGERGLVPPPQPLPGVFEQRCAGFRLLFRTHVGVTTPWRHDQFVASYRGRRQAVYQQASDSLKVRPVCKRDAVVSTFLKNEKINFTAKADPAPRVIQPRSPRYNVEVGKFLKKIEHAVYHCVDNVWGHTTIMKGHNAHATAQLLREKWEKFRDPVAVGLDASRFDQHVSLDALRFEHSFYKLFYRGSDRAELAELLSWQLHNKGYGRAPDGKVSYSVNGRRMSGDMNTGMGNCLLMCAMVWAFSQHAGLQLELANNGDDCVVFLERRNLGKLHDLGPWFSEMGFNMKIEAPVDVFERIEFCQTQPIWDGRAWVMVRSGLTAIAKDCCILHPMHSKASFDKWRYVLAEAGLHLTGGIPIFQSFYKALGHGGIPSRMLASPQFETGMMRLARGMHRQYGPVHPAARVSFWLAFGIVPDMQEAIESYFEAHPAEFCEPRALKIGEFPTPVFLRNGC